MKNIIDDMDFKLRPILNRRADIDLFDSIRILNLYENNINKICRRLYAIDSALATQVKNDTHEATQIW